MIKARKREPTEPQPGAVISIIGPGMQVTGDMASEGTIRVEGRVVGRVRADKAVVVGKGGVVDGDVTTQDAVISGTVTGTVVAASRLEVQATARIDGEVLTRRMKLEEGAVVNGRVRMDDDMELDEASRWDPARGREGEAAEDPDRGPEEPVQEEDTPAGATAGV